MGLMLNNKLYYEKYESVKGNSYMYVIIGKGNLVRLLAGVFILLSVALGYFASSYWFLFTIFVGINLILSSLTGFCLLEKILMKLGAKKSNVTM
jgi:hypothetical protein